MTRRNLVNIESKKETVQSVFLKHVGPCSCCFKVKLIGKWAAKGKCSWCSKHCWYFLVDDNKGQCLRYLNSEIKDRKADGAKCRFCGVKIKRYDSELHYWAKVCSFDL